MKKFKRILATLLSATMLLSFASCGESSSSGKKPAEWTVETVYAKAKELGFEGTWEEFKEEMRGLQGVGIKGVHVNDDGDLIVSLTDDTELNCGSVRGSAEACKHTYGNYKTGAAATCESIGYKMRVCSKCGDVEYSFQEAKGHKWISAEGIPSYLNVCETCGVLRFIGDVEDPDIGNQDDPSIDKTKSLLNVSVFNDGIGSAWIENAAKRFEAQYADVSFADGKAGVQVSVELTKNPMPSQVISADKNQIYFSSSNVNILDMISQGVLLDITDIATETLTAYGEQKNIDQKLDARAKTMCVGDNKYYALPAYEYYPGLTYDVELFEDNNLFFADSSASESRSFTSKFGTANFVSASTAQKSCGPDGIFDTQDDGLPSSLVELLILCDYMKYVNVAPLGMTGQYPIYSNYLLSALWASLAGYEKMQAVYDFEGEIEVVSGLSEENLFSGIDYVKKPITEKITLTPETGYRVYDMVEKYYATAFLTIAEKEGWFSSSSYSAVTNHLDAPTEFVLNGMTNKQEVGMLIEGSYWHNEATNAGIFEQYNKLTNKPERNVAWMSLPVSLNTSVSQGNGQKPTLLNLSNSYAFINGNIKGDNEKQAVSKAFLQFLYTDSELCEFTKQTGMYRPASYELTDNDTSELNAFARSTAALRRSGNVLQIGAWNQTFRKNAQQLNLGLSSSVYRLIYQDTAYTNVFEMLRRGKTAQEVLKAKNWWTMQVWGEIYQEGKLVWTPNF